MAEDPYGEAGEAALRAFVETATGGKVVRMERQVRWRPAWFVDVEADGELRQLHLRGDRGGDVAIFPDLEREAKVIGVLSEHGVAVPRIHGYCRTPPAILMDALLGTRDMTGVGEADRGAILRQYVAQVAAMHRVPVEPFIAQGVRLPDSAQELALAGVAAYTPLYQRTKSRPEPMLEFVLGWIRRNTPQHRTRPAFIQFDSGQFLHQDGRMTGLYDFEFSMIGDPMVDIATMRMRDDYEPLGLPVPEICRLYEEASGEPIDDWVVQFHTLQFSTIAAMQFTGTVGALRPGDPHATYLEFDLALRQVALLALSALTGFAIPSEPPLSERTGDDAAQLAKLADLIGRITPASPTEGAHKDAALKLVEWLERSDAAGDEAKARDLANIGDLLGRRFEERAEAEAALEAYVMQAGPEQDQALFELFARMEGRRMHLYRHTRIGASADHVKLPPIR